MPSGPATGAGMACVRVAAVPRRSVVNVASFMMREEEWKGGPNGKIGGDLICVSREGGVPGR